VITTSRGLAKGSHCASTRQLSSIGKVQSGTVLPVLNLSRYRTGAARREASPRNKMIGLQKIEKEERLVVSRSQIVNP